MQKMILSSLTLGTVLLSACITGAGDAPVSSSSKNPSSATISSSAKSSTTLSSSINSTESFMNISSSSIIPNSSMVLLSSTKISSSITMSSSTPALSSFKISSSSWQVMSSSKPFSSTTLSSSSQIINSGSGNALIYTMTTMNNLTYLCQYYSQVPAGTDLNKIAQSQSNTSVKITVANQCPTTNLLGSCSVKDAAAQSAYSTYYYSMNMGTDATLKTTYANSCASAGGVWK